MAETMFVGTLLSVLTMLVAGAVALVRHFARKVSAHPVGQVSISPHDPAGCSGCKAGLHGDYAKQVGQHRLNHPGSDRWTGGDKKDDL